MPGELRLRTYSNTAAVRSSQQQYQQQQNVNSAPGSCRQQATHPHGTNCEPSFSGNTRGTRAHTTKLSDGGFGALVQLAKIEYPGTLVFMVTCNEHTAVVVDDLPCVLTLPAVEERTCKLHAAGCRRPGILRRYISQQPMPHSRRGETSPKQTTSTASATTSSPDCDRLPYRGGVRSRGAS